MKVPYVKKWQKEADKLRKIALDCDLTEELKWSKSCFTFQRKNVAIVIPLKESIGISFGRKPDKLKNRSSKLGTIVCDNRGRFPWALNPSKSFPDQACRG